MAAPEVTPTQRSLKHLRDEGYTATVVEYWHAFARQRRDLWGCFDILAVKRDETVAVQTTSTGVAARVRKIEACPHLSVLREAGWTILVHGWRKGANGRYALRVVDLS